MAAVKQLGSILKTNVRACKALGHAYVLQLGRIYLDMLNVYKIMSENIIQAISVNGMNVTNQPLIKAMHVVKKETLTLISEWVSRSTDDQMVIDNFIPPLLDAVLLDYQRCTVPSARESKVLSTMAAIVNRLRASITAEVPKIFDAVFECTLDMINKNFEEHPQHRTSFYELLQAVNAHCFEAFLNIPHAQFKLVFDSIVWAFRHTMRNVADMGLNILYKVSVHFLFTYSFVLTYAKFIVDVAKHCRTATACTEFLSDILHRYTDAHILSGDGHIAYARYCDACPNTRLHVHAGGNK